MYTIVNGYDHTFDIPGESLHFRQALNDPLPRADFLVYDNTSTISLDIGQEVVIWDENAPAINGGATPAPPSQNYLINPMWSFGAANWTDQSGGHITYPSTNAVLTFSNLAVGAYYITQTTLKGYAHPGVAYMLSCYVVEASLVNGDAFLQIQYQDAANNSLGSFKTTFTPTTTNTRYNISGLAPANTMFIQAQVGGDATNSTNSGSITFTSAQLEPMWFSTEGVSYPTPDLNVSQVSVYLLPDNTCSRYARVFAGYIDTLQASYEGKFRTWTVSCAGPGAILENALINKVYTSQYDDQIISDLVNTYFNTTIALTTPNSAGAPAPVVRGVLIDSVSYNDNTMREAMNGLADASGYMFYLDWYYRLQYNPQFYNAATFTLTDGTPDNISSFNYYNYSWEKDGTQRKRRIKILGGKASEPGYQDVFSGNGSNKVFILTFYPHNVTQVQVGGVNQKFGLSGVHTLGVNGYVALVNKTALTLTFQNAPASGTNNVTITYTYEAPVVVQTLDQDATNTPLAPQYVVPTYDAKVTDTNITSIIAATTRGLAELTKFGPPKTIIKCMARKYAPVGSIIYFTSALDSISNQPYVVQQVEGAYLAAGNILTQSTGAVVSAGQNQYTYTLGYYQPTLLDHIHNANKALNRSITTSGVTAILQIDLAVQETVVYSETVTVTANSAKSAGVWGTATWGGFSWS